MSDYSNNDLIHIKNNNIEYIKFKVLEKYNDRLTHGFFLRHGGVSTGIYESLNVGFEICDDSKENVLKNIEISANELGINTTHICKITQTHTDKSLILNSKNKEKYLLKKSSKEEYDAYITNEKNIATFITTADCAPIIIYDPIKNVVGNIHSGWKGTIKKIAIKTAINMHDNFKSKYSNMIVCVGPTISKCCFSSKDEWFKNEFVSVCSDVDNYIIKKEDKFFIDTNYIIKKNFLELGVKEENIVFSNICTMCNGKDFFSFRNTKKNNESDFARQGTFIALK